MRSLRINIEDMQIAQKLDTLLSLFGDDIEIITLILKNIVMGFLLFFKH